MAVSQPLVQVYKHKTPINTYDYYKYIDTDVLLNKNWFNREERLVAISNHSLIQLFSERRHS